MDILTQIRAARAALKRVEDAVAARARRALRGPGHAQRQRGRAADEDRRAARRARPFRGLRRRGRAAMSDGGAGDAGRARAGEARDRPGVRDEGRPGDGARRLPRARGEDVLLLQSPLPRALRRRPRPLAGARAVDRGDGRRAADDRRVAGAPARPPPRRGRGRSRRVGLPDGPRGPRDEARAVPDLRDGPRAAHGHARRGEKPRARGHDAAARRRAALTVPAPPPRDGRDAPRPRARACPGRAAGCRRAAARDARRPLGGLAVLRADVDEPAHAAASTCSRSSASAPASRGSTAWPRSSLPGLFPESFARPRGRGWRSTSSRRR